MFALLGFMNDLLISFPSLNKNTIYPSIYKNNGPSLSCSRSEREIHIPDCLPVLSSLRLYFLSRPHCLLTLIDHTQPLSSFKFTPPSVFSHPVPAWASYITCSALRAFTLIWYSQLFIRSMYIYDVSAMYRYFLQNQKKDEISHSHETSKCWGINTNKGNKWTCKIPGVLRSTRGLEWCPTDWHYYEGENTFLGRQLWIRNI